MALNQVIGVYDIDLSNDTSFCMIKAPQGDGRIRYIRFALYDKGQSYILPDITTVDVLLEGINGAGANVLRAATIVDNMVEIELIDGVNSVPGAGIYRIVITERNNYESDETPVSIATFNFYIFIVDQKFNAHAAVATEDYQALLRALSSTNGWKYGAGDPPEDPETIHAKVNDLYLDTRNGNVWALTQDGSGSVEWVFLVQLKGTGLDGVEVKYALSNQHITPPTTGWVSTYPTVTDEAVYLWTRQTFTMDDETLPPVIAYTVNYLSTAAEAYAVGTRDGQTVESGDPAYHNNAKYFKDVASEEASDSYNSSLDSEAWAIGTREGTPVDSEDDTYENNSKYYATQSKSSAEDAEDHAESAENSATTASTSATTATTAATTAETQAGIAVDAANDAEDSAKDSEAWAVGQRDGEDVPSTDETYHNNAKYYADFVSQAVDEHIPQFTINWETGMLEYTGGYFTFWIDDDGFLRWGVESTI